MVSSLAEDTGCTILTHDSNDLHLLPFIKCRISNFFYFLFTPRTLDIQQSRIAQGPCK